MPRRMLHAGGDIQEQSQQTYEPAFIDRKLPGLYNARRDSLGKYWKDQFGVSHAVMLAESFFENVDREGKNAVLHFVPKPAATMLIACLCSEWRDPKGGPNYFRLQRLRMSRRRRWPRLGMIG